MHKDSSEWQDMLAAARSIDQQYQALDKARLGRIWSLPEFLAACSTDWGELVEHILVLEGIRPGEENRDAVQHELGDMLWALIVIADRLDLDLKECLLATMSELEARFKDKE